MAALVLLGALLLVAPPSVSSLSSPSRPLVGSNPLRGTGRFFLDTADVAEWDALLPLGVFHGVTTNPTLLERAGVPCDVESVTALARRALEGADEFMCQAWGESAEEMYERGMELSEADRARIVIKVPVTQEGTKAASRLVRSGVRVCLTACYASNQALVAAGVGAEYLAPYLGRMTDAGKDGAAECLKMHKIARGMGSDCRILVASIRTVDSMAELSAGGGLDTYTFSPDVARALFDEPLTEKAARDFEEAAARGAVEKTMMKAEASTSRVPL